MNVGSKVICINDSFPQWARELYAQLPVKDTAYTVREMSSGRGVLCVVKDGKFVPNGGGDKAPEIRLLLEELHNPPDPLCCDRELGFNAERFADLQEETETSTAEQPIAVGQELAFSGAN